MGVVAWIVVVAAVAVVALIAWRVAAARRDDIGAGLALPARLEACERNAKAPAYAGRGEFEKNRLAARDGIARLRGESAESATGILEAARDRLRLGFLAGEAADRARPARVCYRPAQSFEGDQG